MFSVAPVSSLGAPMAPVRSANKHKRAQSQPRSMSYETTVESEGLIALGYHQTEQGAPPVPCIPARSYLRTRSNSSSASIAPPNIVTTEIPPVPPLPVGPATLKKRPSRLLKNPSSKPGLGSRDILEARTRPPMPSQAPPRPPRPADADCLLYPPTWQPPPVPPVPTGLITSAPRVTPRSRHGYSHSTSSIGSTAGSVSNSSSGGAPSISTPRHSQDSVEFRHVPLSSSLTGTHSRDSSFQSVGSHPQTIEPPSMSVFEESSDDDDHLHERGTGSMFRKGGMSLITRTAHKNKNNTGPGATASAVSGQLHTTHEHHRSTSDEAQWKFPSGARHSPTNSIPGLSDGSESSELSSMGERTPIDDVLSRRHGKISGHKSSQAKADHPDEELILMMQALKTPKRRDSSMRRSRVVRSGAEDCSAVSAPLQEMTVVRQAGVAGADGARALEPEGAAPLISTSIPGHRLACDKDLAALLARHTTLQHTSPRHQRHDSDNHGLDLQVAPLHPPRGRVRVRRLDDMVDSPPPERRAPRSFPLVSAVRRLDVNDAALESTSAVPTAPIESDPPRTSSSHNSRTKHARTDSSESNKPALDPSPDILAAVPRTNPPAIRLISADAEKESQKVRSLYDSGEGLRWEDAGPPPPLPHGTPSRPSADFPSVVEHNEHDARDDEQQQSTRYTHASSNVTLTDGDDPNLPQPWTDQRTHDIEDWEGVNVGDVDRYGFITPARPQTRATTADGSGSSPDSTRKSRSTLRKKVSNAGSLHPKRGPSRKSSARSLYSHASDISTATHRSSRSPMRNAMNLLPHNRDRRLVDDAGDVLALEPGLTNIAEDEAAEILANEAKRKEISRTEKWRRMATVIKHGEEGQGMAFEFDQKHPKLLKRTWKGIPDRWRSAAWYSFLETSAKASGESYTTEEQLTKAFTRLLDEPSPDDGQIDLDVPRTINQHIMFRRRYRGGQRLLFRVLHCVSLYFPDTGYVQGMAPLAATLLSYYDEEKCFIMLTRLWQYRGLKWLYTEDFTKLLAALEDFDKLWLRDRDVAKLLTELCVHPTAYATRWYLTLFNLAIPFAAQLRIWDVFMLLGVSPPRDPVISPPAPPLGPPVDETTEATPEPESPKLEPGQCASQGLEILHAASAAIIDVYNDTLVDSDFENAMKILTSWVPIRDVEHFMGVVHAEWKRHNSNRKNF